MTMPGTKSTDVLGSDIDVAYFVLADAAQVVDGKLYLIGGGWDVVWVGQFPAAHPFAVCVGLRVPWDHTNTPHTMNLVVETADGQILGQIQGKFEVGKPAGLAQGSAQLINLAFQSTLSLDAPGRFRIRAMIDDKLVDELAFGVVQRQSS
jgi:hypothetical protein